MQPFSFRSVAFADIPLICWWFNQPHVQKFYSLRSWTEAQVREKFAPCIKGEKPVEGYMIEMNKMPMGYIQFYKIIDFPWPEQALSDDVVANAAGMDLLIGEQALIGKGLGTQIVQQFIDEMIFPKFQYCIVDPDIQNEAAVLCYKKLNFKTHKILHTHDSLNNAATLELMILKKSCLA